MNNKAHHTERGRERLVGGDLFAETDTIVIPIKTGGRTYGVLSRTIAARGVVIPTVAYESAHLLARSEHSSIVFVAFGDDSDLNFDPLRFEKHVTRCTEACVLLAAKKKVKRIAMPLLGGNRGWEALPAMALGVEQAVDLLDEKVVDDPPEIVFITDKAVDSATAGED